MKNTKALILLYVQCGMEANQGKQNYQGENISSSDVKTDLFIGLPNTG